MARIYSASDYAGLESANLIAYYGYEETVGDGDNEEWCFVAKVNDEEIARIPRSQLKVRGDECIEFLLIGIATLFDTHKLQ
jgi:hypothetical protein